MASSSGVNIPVEPPPGIQQGITPPGIATGMPTGLPNPMGLPTEMAPPSAFATPSGSRGTSPDGQPKRPRATQRADGSWDRREGFVQQEETDQRNGISPDEVNRMIAEALSKFQQQHQGSAGFTSSGWSQGKGGFWNQKGKGTEDQAA